MKFADLAAAELARLLLGPGIDLQTGPFVSRIKSPLFAVAEHLRSCYADFPHIEPSEVVDFHVSISTSYASLILCRPQVQFRIDGSTVAMTFPRRLAVPMVEWGMNWCIYRHAHQYLVIHSAVLERNGRAILLAAPPGSGKSTLCAALAHSGWRLLSDELAIVSLDLGCVYGLARPISLKNEAIEVIRQAFPSSVIGPAWRATHKGTVAHVLPSSESVAKVHEAAKPAWIVFPKYQAGTATCLESVRRGPGLMRLIDNCFNYNILCTRGFETLARLTEECSFYEFTYSNLIEALACFDRLEPVVSRSKTVAVV